VLPAFDAPPVVEVAVGIEFLPIDELNTVELIRLHDTWKDDFPSIRLQPEVPSANRLASQLPSYFEAGVQPVRLWSLTADENLLVQVQADRLVVNWRRMAGDAAYPRYETLRRDFVRRWAQLNEHLELIAAPDVRPLVADVTYVNVINYDADADPATVLNFLQPSPGLLPAQALQVQRVTLFPSGASEDGGGTLSITGVVEAPGRLRLDVAARIRLEVDGRLIDPLEALDRAHVLGVEAFVACTSEVMQRRWGRRA
jgi:uncharacterized protein (TIGR04255 family)